MSATNVEVVRSVGAAYVHGDVDEALSHLDPGIVYKRAEEAAVRGRDAVREAWRRWEADWEGLDTIIEDAVDAGDFVILTVLFRGRGRASGVEVEGRYYEVFELRDGKVVRWDEFADQTEALAAAGLANRD